MPVTKTAKRALRGSKRKKKVNTVIMTKLEIALRSIKKSPSKKAVERIYSLSDKASKKKIIHKNKAARIKAQATKLLKNKN